MRLLSDLELNIRFNEPLAPHTSFKIGGLARFYATPKNLTELLYVLKFREREGVPLRILGAGSNTLFADEGYSGLILNMSEFEKNFFRAKDSQVEVSSGISLHQFVSKLKKESLGGLEFLDLIPGTVGGALILNAGFGKNSSGERQEISHCLEEVSLLTPEGNFERLKKDKIHFGYRSSSLRGNLILHAVFYLTPEDPKKIQERIAQGRSYRKQVQDWNHPSAGSIFKNPAPSEWTVGEMVDRLGLKGVRVGGAEISQVHGNFIVNKGGAKAQDVLELIQLIQEKVFKEFQVNLESEVEYVGV